MSVVLWFRKGLRVHDNAALVNAAKLAAGGQLYPIFMLDPWFVDNAKIGTNRFAVLLECLRDLDKSLRKLGSRLIVLQGNPTSVFPNLFKELNVKYLCFEKDFEPYAKTRDAEVIKLAKTAEVEVKTFAGHTLFDIDDTMKACKNKVPKSYGGFQKLLATMGDVPKPIPVPSALPTFEDAVFKSQVKMLKGYTQTFDVPSLEDIKRDPSEHTTPFKGGESVGLEVMENYLKDKQRVLKFEKPKTSPNALSPETTVLSPHMKYGSVSCRLFWHRLTEICKGNTHTQPPVSLKGQLLWREYFTTFGHATPNFDKMVGNPICKQIGWETDSTIIDQRLTAWREGKTGYPFIDACMAQLKHDGWIHHLARHSVACFLTRGDLWISWEKGRDVFDELLIDGDWAINNANWMWLSASSFFYMFYRVYSPIAFGKKTDPEGKYIKKWLPIFKHYPKKYIYEPWKAPKELQKQWKCVIGKDYPQPIVDHDVVKKENIEKMKFAYDSAKTQTKKTQTTKTQATKTSQTKKQKLK